MSEHLLVATQRKDGHFNVLVERVYSNDWFWEEHLRKLRSEGFDVLSVITLNDIESRHEIRGYLRGFRREPEDQTDIEKAAIRAFDELEHSRSCLGGGIMEEDCTCGHGALGLALANTLYNSRLKKEAM